VPSYPVPGSERRLQSPEFEGGGQPISGASGVIPDPIEKGVPDLPTNAFFAYGHYEGIPRVLSRHRLRARTARLPQGARPAEARFRMRKTDFAGISRQGTALITVRLPGCPNGYLSLASLRLT
jgi:hypothetical protein